MLFTAIPRWSKLNMLFSRVRGEAVYQLFHQRIRIAAVLGNFARVAIKMLGVEPLVHHTIEQRFAQHLNQPLAPVAYLLAQREILLLKILAIAGNGLHQITDACTICCDRLDDGRSPIVTPDGKRLHSSNLALHAIGSLAIALVDHEDISDFHDAGLDRLHIISHSGNEDHDRNVCETHDVNFILTDANGLHENHVFSSSVEQCRNICSSGSQAAEESSRSHAADIN